MRHRNLGRSQTADANILKIVGHQSNINSPARSLVAVHGLYMHPGTNMVASYLGLTWWDNESDGSKLYPAKQHNPGQDEEQ
jgi:hypothetical protein